MLFGVDSPWWRTFVGPEHICGPSPSLLSFHFQPPSSWRARGCFWNPADISLILDKRYICSDFQQSNPTSWWEDLVCGSLAARERRWDRNIHPLLEFVFCANVKNVWWIKFHSTFIIYDALLAPPSTSRVNAWLSIPWSAHFPFLVSFPRWNALWDT